MAEMDADKLFEVRRRTFDTPHFRGIEFIEVEAKSIINHVPGTYLPFNWTINPYRGCSHACVYCLSGETPILMADGRTKTLRDVRVGDEVYGTERVGSKRGYVKTSVRAHWRTVKAAYRVILCDGTELVASADHRFLSDRGWKHVTGAQQGTRRRPHLTTSSKLAGTGAFAAGPQGGSDYKRGYLHGLTRGDGHLGSSAYPREDRSRAEVRRLRPALTDLEAILRARSYGAEEGSATQRFVVQAAIGGRKTAHTVRTPARAGGIRDVIGVPLSHSDEWCKGFLAGIFDAEGSYTGILRIAGSDHELVEQVKFCLERLGFEFRTEAAVPRLDPVTYVRIIGGLREHLRFFHTVDPAVTRKRTIQAAEVESDARLGIVSIESLDVDIPMYDITTGTGDFIANGVVSHNCFARATHTYLDMDAGRDFETKIVVKVNAPELLRRELRARRWKGEHIAMGTATDPYQRAEGRYRIMPRVVESLVEVGNPFSILTKGTLILRDLDLLAQAAAVTEVSTALSIGTLDDDAWRRSEPGTPHPRKRMEAVARLNAAGVPCGVMVAPVLPGITNSARQLRDVITAALDAGATHVSPILLHLRPKVKEVYMGWLEDNFPDLVPRYRATYEKSAYASATDKRALGQTVAEIVDDLGGVRARPASKGARRRDARAAGTSPEQLSLLRPPGQ
jgi:DNA repair photolyase